MWITSTLKEPLHSSLRSAVSAARAACCVETRPGPQQPLTKLRPPADLNAVQDVLQEHGILTRRLGALQQSLDAQARAVAGLESENLRLRAALMVSHTAGLWGLGYLPPARSALPDAVQPVPAMPEGQGDLLCRIACEGHAHHWLGSEGQCLRTAQACTRMQKPD